MPNRAWTHATLMKRLDEVVIEMFGVSIIDGNEKFDAARLEQISLEDLSSGLQTEIVQEALR